MSAPFSQSPTQSFDWAAPDPSLQTWNASHGKASRIAEWIDQGSDVSRTQSSTSQQKNHQPFVVDGRWKTAHLLGAGSFGDVFDAQHVLTGESVAVKLEHTSSRKPFLHTDFSVLSELANLHGPLHGVPQLLHYGQHGPSQYVLVMQKLGPSLDVLRSRQKSKRLSLKTVLAIGIQAISCLERLHAIGYVHCDVKPDNMLVGLNDPSRLYLVDFGLARKFVDDSANHLPEQSYEGLIGTLPYVSLTAHRGTYPSRRCDLESLAYSLIELLHGTLPWFVEDRSGLGCRPRWKRVEEQKRRMDLPHLCGGAAPLFDKFFNYVRALEYAETPDYDMLRALLREGMQARALRDDGSFEWCRKMARRKWYMGVGGLLLSFCVASICTRRTGAFSRVK